MKKLLFGALLGLVCSFGYASGSSPAVRPFTAYRSRLTPDAWRFAKSDAEAMALASREFGQPLIPLASVAGPTNGGVVYGNGTHLAQSAAPTTGYLLQGNSSGAPNWAALGSLIAAGSGISVTGTTSLTLAAAFQSLTAGTGLSITSTTGNPTISIANTLVTPGSYTNASVTVNQQGQLTAASSGPAPVTSVIGGTGVTVTGATTPTVSIGQSVATSATPSFSDETLNPTWSQNGLTINYPSAVGGASGLIVVDNNGNTMFAPFWGTNGKLTIDGYALRGASSNQATMQLGTAPSSYASSGSVFSNYLTVDNGSGSSSVCGNLGYYASQTHNSSAYGTDAVVELVANGSTLLTNRLWIRNNGDIETNGNEVAVPTSSSSGFLYIPTCAGVPTGTPTSRAGEAPLIYDSTDNALYIWNGSGWAGLPFTGVSATITFLKSAGVNGTMTFTNGVLTAHT